MADQAVRFATVTPDGRELNIRTLAYSSIAKCPHLIITPEHYRADGTCKCNDPNEKVMREWGYSWDRKRKLWVLRK